jgi:alpha-1,2-mannosyltransferase
MTELAHVFLIHPSLNRMGGSERVFLETLRVLKDQGNNVHLYTIDRTNWMLLEGNWGVKARPDEETFFQDRVLDPQDSYSWAWTTVTYLWMLMRAQMEEGISINNYGEVFPFISDVSYVHSRPLAAMSEENPYGAPMWGLTRKIYDRLYDKLSQSTQGGTLLTNSGYNAGIIRESLNREARVVHPFIEPVLYRGEPKTGNVLTVSRIAPGKNLTILLEVAQRARGPRFTLAGRIQPNSDKVLSYLRRHPRLDIHTNPSREEILNLMRRSSVYLSTQPDEAFGISILEAMSAGCVPIVYRDGGPWFDILGRREGESGFSYSSTDEAAMRIDEVLADEQLRESLRNMAVERSREFTVERFEGELTEALESVEPHGPMEGRLADTYRYIKQLRSRVNETYMKGMAAARRAGGHLGLC